MSKISLAPAAAGTAIFTIESPGTSTNRTLTLPDDTGTIVTNSGNQAGSFTTLNTSGAVVFNDAGADVDFRVEGDTDANLLFVDASADNVGIGTNAPSYRLSVSKASAGDVAQFTNGGASNKSLFVYTDATYAAIATGTSASGNGIAFDATNNAILFTTASQNRATIDSSGNVGIGTSSPNTRLMSSVGSSGSGVVNALRLQNVGTTAGDGAGIVFTAGTSTVGAGIASTGVALDSADLRFYAGGNTERMRIDSSGNLLVGTTSGSSNIIGKNTGDTTSPVLTIGNNGDGFAASAFFGINNVTYTSSNASAAPMRIGSNTTSRSINAAGTINASGADYAEYMTKAGEFELAKGDICGIKADGKLTNVFADAVAFVVKSTNPSYVGGDTWGTEETIGNKPEKPIQQAAEVDEEGNETQAAETDEDFAARQAQYEVKLAEFEAKLEAERQKVDRIAFSGQVPVNVTGATAGQYIVPVESNGGITGVAVNEADMTLAQYMKAVGKVIAIEADGRAKIIVKVA